MTRLNRLDLLTLAIVSLGLTTFPAYAYVDPGSVSIVVTAILGAIATVGYTFRLYWAKLLALLGIDAAAKNRAKLRDGGTRR